MPMLIFHTLCGVSCDGVMGVHLSPTPFHAHGVHVAAHDVKYGRHTVVPRWPTTCHHVPFSALFAVHHVHCEHGASCIRRVLLTLRPYVHCVHTNPRECISRVAAA